MTITEASIPADDTDSAHGISLRSVTKSFGDFHAVHELDLDVAQGEFFSMLGPSGSGKTTVLRMIAGFEEPTAGAILLDGLDVSRTAPFDRDVNTVFQDYALFPHLTVAENVAYGLEVRKVRKAERTERVSRALEQVRLPELGSRLPHQLSGGQRQRIALARALVLEPKVLLLDEPLGALDKQLREEMQIELKRIQREVGITFIFVTHDQEEALTLSDRIAVFNAGRVEQVGSPVEVYEHPATPFVAGFLGLSNLVSTPAAELFGAVSLASLRPERIRILPPDSAVGGDETVADGVVLNSVYTGPSTRYLVQTELGLTLVASHVNDAAPGDTASPPVGAAVRLAWQRSAVYSVPE